MIRIVQVPRTQRVAVLRNGAYHTLLQPGVHVLWTLGDVVELVEIDVSRVVERLRPDDPLPREVHGAARHVVPDGSRGVVRVDGVVTEVIAPGAWRVWSMGTSSVEVSLVDVTAEPTPLAATDRLPDHDGMREIEAAGGTTLVLYRDGAPLRALEPGRYRWWVGGPWTLHAVDTSLAVLELAAQDVVTRDQVPVRLKAAVQHEVTDPLRYARTRHAQVHLYSALHLALREVVASHTLDELTALREELGDALLARARVAMPDVGIAVHAAWVRDVILPGEVKDLVSRVTLARKEAEAQAIRRREEVAATRQLANTAKLLEGSPILLRLKELEAMGELVGRIDKLVVVGGGDLARHVLLRDTDL